MIALEDHGSEKSITEGQIVRMIYHFRNDSKVVNEKLQLPALPDESHREIKETRKSVRASGPSLVEDFSIRWETGRRF